MKGIILAGGKGTRLYPITKAISKQLLPLYDKPMIYYPLSVLLLADIKDILLISTPYDLPDYKKLLGNGHKFGINIRYEAQEKPRGLAEAFIIGEDFIKNDKVGLILGDNIFYGQGFTQIIKESANIENGAIIFGYYVKKPSQFGVVEIEEETDKVISIEEKPIFPKSNYAIPGLYFYDNTVIEKAKSLKPSKRGEIEITDLNKQYLKEKSLSVKLFGRGLTWFDTGTPDGLLNASNYVEAVQKRQGLYIACLEEIAYRKGYIDNEQLMELAKEQSNSEYGRYIQSIVENGINPY